MIVEKAHFHFTLLKNIEGWGEGVGKAPLAHPVPTALDSHEAIHIACAQNKGWSLEY